MKNIVKYLMLGVVAVFGFILTSCNDDDTNMSRKVLTSVTALEFEAQNDGIRILTVTSDGDWTVEAPEWVNVSPSSGSAGQTEVEITVNDNFLDGSLDKPRKAEVLFKGRNLESIATVIVRQGGDKFRNPDECTFDGLKAVSDETVVRVSNIVVSALTRSGFIATDGSDYMYIPDAELQVAVGNKVSVLGEKHTDGMNMIYVKGEKITIEGTGTLNEVEPMDITENLDATSGTKYQYVTVTGNFDGSSITVENNVCKAYMKDAAQELKVNSYARHKIKVTGYYSGIASPVVNIIPTKIENLGIIEGMGEIVYFSDDFEWLEQWSVGAGVGSTVETDDLNAVATALTSIKGDVDGKQMTLFDYTEKVKGYTFVYDKDDNKRTYLNRNYFKFGKTGNHSGITLPTVDIEPETPVILEFDWCPMRQGSGKIDPVNLYIVIENGNSKEEIDVPTHGWEDGHILEWIHAEVDLSDYNIDKDTKITITQREWDISTANRWFLDNIKLKLKE